MPYLFKFKN